MSVTNFKRNDPKLTEMKYFVVLGHATCSLILVQFSEKLDP